MGYKRNPKVYKLRFQDGDMAGLEVTLRSVSVGQVIELGGLGADTSNGETVEQMVELLAERIVEWNLEDENGAPVPPTLEALKNEDLDFVLAIINEWTSAAAGVSAPLETPSPSGETSLEASLPMEVLSPSLAS
ncbi:hypothetical protein IPZ58_07480 [Streptomyces roseoverticillatus]|uniref:hypothetical protein n=1 Tax=Streptomyces roseoverticillatus TaxID=66429 RepID=UPI001F3959A2|nr:hypothetical protein [Streptomyces roseoverticillatus]MCF3101420.1 hypothetical protein [Streptomyces roseoverticillatus]